jgi:hexosaminidase
MKKACLFFLFILFRLIAQAQSLQIIPQPADVKILPEPPFVITRNTPFFFISGRCMANVIEFNSLLKKTYGFEMGWTMEVVDTNQKFIYLQLTKDSVIKNPEGYEIECTRNYIKITASGRPGLFYGMISVLQMMQPNMEDPTSFMVPACKIKDEPRFKWRGMHLDVCRHFYGKEFIKKYIDLLALHKLNTFHWHLTEDQGWRIEIKKYPRLTEIGAWRNGSMVGPYSDHTIDTVRYGGFYTQDDVREIVKYAASRHITVVPEIEMPGHALAALAAYPELSCTGGPFEVAKEWGVFEDVYCAGNENTFAFIEDVLTEVCGLFPGKYIHIGGDECPKERWKQCAKCQKRMKDEGLKDEHELQSYFIRRIEKFLNSKGKQIIGWDEILEGGLAPNAAVMSWRGEEGGIEAANQQHNVVMSPGSHCYFDHYQGDPSLEPLAIGGFTPIEKVYAYDPVPAGLNDSLAKYILGAQANVWTEYILTKAQVEYMALPRMCALAEVLWTPKEKKDPASFQDRLIQHFGFLDKWGINYSKSIYQIQMKPAIKDKEYGVNMFLKPRLGSITYTMVPLNNPDSVEYGGMGYSPPSDNFPPFIDTLFHAITQSGTFKIKLGEMGTSSLSLYLSKSTAQKITYNTPPSKYYNTDPHFTLVNGLKADLPRKNNQWNAWSGTDVEISIDLNSVQEISQVEIGYLQNLNDWIWLPKTITIEGSTNGKKYQTLQTLSSETILQNPRQVMTSFKKTKTRYIKIKATNPGKIPAGYAGAGEDSWLFFDEILID